jgi:hypothetical protein
MVQCFERIAVVTAVKTLALALAFCGLLPSWAQSPTSVDPADFAETGGAPKGAWSGGYPSPPRLPR